MRKSRWARRAAFLGCFTALGLFSGSRIWLGAAYSARPVTWPTAFGFALADWYAWGLVAPVVFLLARRFPFERQGGRPWLRALAVHLPAGVALTVVKMLIEHAAAQTIAFNPARRLSILYFHPNFLTYLAILGVVVALDARRRLHEQWQRASALETRLAQARLDALRTQLQPHFLFNTLNAVTALMRHDVRAAESMLVGLADLLRMSLAGGGAQQVALSGEIELIRKYLEILSIRYGERLSVSIDVPVSAMDVLVPALILQPIVENAVRHGVAARERGGRVEVDAAIGDGRLTLRVRDDGPGLVDAGDGVGLANTRARLQALYGPAHRLDLSNRPEGGLAVTLEIPLRRAEGAG